MLRILNKTIEDLNNSGFNVNAVVGDRYILNRNSEQEGIMFHFEMPTYENITNSDDLRWTLVYWIDAPKLEVDYDIDIDETIIKTNEAFKRLLKYYQNEQGQQLLYDMKARNQGFADMGKETKTTGYMTTLNITQQLTDVC